MTKSSPELTRAQPAADLPVSELYELERAHRDFVERLQRGETDLKRDLALQQRVLELVRSVAQKSNPVQRHDPKDPFRRAHAAAELFDIGIHGSHRKGTLGRLVTKTKRSFVHGLKPFHTEMLRPQRVFNYQFLGFAEQLLEPSALTERSVLADMARQTLSALAQPDAWKIASPRRGAVGRTVDAVKRKYLDTVKPLLASVLARQHGWNLAAMRALDLTLSVDPVSLSQIHLVLGEMRELGRLPAPAELADVAKSTFPFWVDLFRRQEVFNVAITQMFTALFDLPRPADDGRLAAYPISVARLEHQRMAEVARLVKKLTDRPLISIIVPTYETPVAVIRSCIDSVRNQSYDNWELCIVDDGSRSVALRKTLDEYAQRDRRIRVKYCFNNRGIAHATNEALGLASGDWVAFLDHDDELSPHALGEVALYLRDRPDTDFLYTDEDRLDLRGQRMLPFFKPDWSPDLLRACNYICHFLVARRSLVDEVGRIRPGFDGAQDYDLVLRMSEKTRRIGHVPQVVYHWRASPQSTAMNAAAKPMASTAGVRALQQHLQRSGELGRIDTPIPTNYRVTYDIKHAPKVSLIIATERAAASAQRLISSIEEVTSYEDLELVVCHQAPTTKLRSTLPLKTVGVTKGAKVAEAFQLGARIADGEILILLHDDLVAIDPSWVRELVGHALRPGVGVVGPKLVYADGTIAHAGFVVGGVTEPVSPFAHMADMNEWTTMGSPNWTRNYLAVSGACMALRRSTWETVGGFDGKLELTDAAVDFCMRVRERGSRVVFTPHTKLVCWYEATPIPANAVRKAAVEFDPYYNPNLSTRITNGRVRAVAALDG